MTTTNWGHLIRELREEQNVSQRQLSIQAKINRQTLRKLEDGYRHAQFNHVESCLNVLGYELDAMRKGG
ncbi:helix-turn-helix domain-containing protein [Pelagibacterium mangrovi]|uniref:helix-turn-helix domain-containing protein n=1 Tax=Pelagibacterium mangrovi TaxID=3119828 RepID=UPI002FC5E7AF